MGTTRDVGLCQKVKARERYEADRLKGPLAKLQWLFTGKRHEPAPSYFGVVESETTEPRIGICCSGGGIRSASYNLGALQALNEGGQLQRADYLAAVSGGSYIAAGMAMVADTTQPEGSDADLFTTSDPEVLKDAPFYRGSPEEQYLRNRSSYLAPGMTAKLGLVYRVALGLLFHLLFLALLLIPLGFLVGWLYRMAFPGLTGRAPEGGWFCFNPTNCDYVASPATWTQTVILITLALCLFLGLLSITFRFQRERTRSIMQFLSMFGLMIPLLVSLFIIWLPATLAALRNLEDPDRTTGVDPSQLTAVGAAGGTSLAAVLLGILLQLRSRMDGPRAVLESSGVIRQGYSKLSNRLRKSFIYLAGAVAGPVLLYAIVVAAALVTVRAENEDIGQLALLALGLQVAFWLIYMRADLTTWSLHPFYRRRLATAFALRRVRGNRVVDGPAGRAEERPYESLPLLSDVKSPSGADKPMLIICAAANISNPGATPPGRGVTSLTFSSESIGGPLVGAVSTRDYLERLDTKRQKDFTLMAAVAMSGAALSPSMGKATRRPLTFLMALANIRLGVWIPNPRRIQEWDSSWVPRPRPSYLFRELFGWNTINAKYLYVTDGGHYENLGLVELLRRGCTHVYCFDASGGKPGTFSELGDAIALARSELGCEIKIDPRKLIPQPDAESLAEADCVVGDIAFPVGPEGRLPEGRLVYARTVLTQEAPWDVHAFHANDPRFPNHPTADQLYTDQKFEAYRALGHQAGLNALKLMREGDTPAESEQDGVMQQTQQNGEAQQTQHTGVTTLLDRHPQLAATVAPTDRSDAMILRRLTSRCTTLLRRCRQRIRAIAHAESRWLA